LWHFYYENGNLHAKGSFAYGKYEKGCVGSGNFEKAIVKMGEWQVWNRDGAELEYSNYAFNEFEESVLEGAYEKHYQDGTIKIRGTYKNNMKVGTWDYYHETGDLARQEHYEYRDCNLYDYNWYECPVGTWKFWNQSSELIKEVHYNNGRATDSTLYSK